MLSLQRIAATIEKTLHIYALMLYTYRPNVYSSTNADVLKNIDACPALYNVYNT